MDTVTDKSAVSLQVEHQNSFTEVQGLRASVSTQQRVVDGNDLESLPSVNPTVNQIHPLLPSQPHLLPSLYTVGP